MTEINDIIALKEDIQKHTGVEPKLWPKVLSWQVINWEYHDTYYKLEWWDGWIDPEDGEWMEPEICIDICVDDSWEYYSRDLSDFLEDLPKLYKNALY